MKKEEEDESVSFDEICNSENYKIYSFSREVTFSNHIAAQYKNTTPLYYYKATTS